MNEEYKKLPKVVGVINSLQVVINRGSEHGVLIGEKYLIFSLGENIQDPDTGEDLGALEIVRGRAKVIHVQPRISTLESIDFITIPGQKRLIKRKGGSFFSLPGGETVEEVEEGVERRQSTIEAMVGDYARPI